MSIVLHGVDQAVAAIDRKVEQMRVATRQATAQVLHLIERRTKQLLTTSTHPPGEPTTSRPGEPPSLVTGNLRRSITVTGPTAVTTASWRGEVGPTAIYGRIQELGGIAGRGAELPARPYLMPAFRELQAQIRAIFERAWTQAIIR